MLRYALPIILFLAATAGTPAWAGPGHDHGPDGGHGGAAEAPVDSKPRFESVGFDVELVGVADGHKLTLYLDNSATNAPVSDAKIEVSGEGIAPAVAKQVSPGTYELEAEWADAPGSKALVFTVTYGEMADLLNGTLVVPEAAVAAPPELTLNDLFHQPAFWGFALGALAFGFIAAFAFRRVSGGGQSTHPDALSDGVTGAAAHISESGREPERRAAARTAAMVLVAAMLALPQQSNAVRAGPGHDHGEAPAAATGGGDQPRKRPDGTAFVPKSTQRLLEIRTQPLAETTAPAVRELIGTVVSDPTSVGYVQAPMDGQIELSERGISYVGQHVKAGEILALLSPTIPLADLGTMQQLRAEVDGKLVIAEQRLRRLNRISNVVAQRDIEDTKAELEALKEQKRVLAPKGVEKFELRAPVSGIIAVAKVRAGQVVSARDTLFEIVDPQRLWVEAIGIGEHGDDTIEGATATDWHGHTIPLAYVGRSPTLRQQSRPFLFRIESLHEGLAIGEHLTVMIKGGNHVKGMILPAASVVRGSNGLPYVWVKDNPEVFRAMPVRYRPLDGERTVILSGIEPGMRAVVSGAELINQVR